MSIFKILLLGMVGASASIILKKSYPEISMMIGIGTGIIILYFTLSMAIQIIDIIRNLSDRFNVSSEYIIMVVKITGITYLGEFTISSLKDVGESGIAAKIELFTKVLIISMSIPVFIRLIDIVSSILI